MNDTRAAIAELHPTMRGNFLAPIYLWVAGQQGPRALLFAAAMGAIANLGFPPVFFWPAFSVALIGLVWSLDSAKLAPKPNRAAFWRVAAFGYTYYLVGLHWIAAAFPNQEKRSTYLAENDLDGLVLDLADFMTFFEERKLRIRNRFVKILGASPVTDESEG